MEDLALLVRSATAADVPALLAFWDAAAKGHSVSDDIDGVTALLNRDPDAILLATVASAAGASTDARTDAHGPTDSDSRTGADGVATASGDVIVGCVISGWDGWRARLYRLSVAPGHRRRGIARALISAAELRLRSLGARRYEAMVLDDNEVGRASWSGAGYHRDIGWSRWLKPVD